jgi:hypothetical protein
MEHCPVWEANSFLTTQKILVIYELNFHCIFKKSLSFYLP